MRPNKDGLCSSEGQMGVLFMGSPYTLRETPSGHFKAEALRNVFAPAGDNYRSPNISAFSHAVTTRYSERHSQTDASPFPLCAVLVEPG